MPSIIRVLNENLINQIAAGEVIENPASVIKELVENSIDAGATSITVEITGGGKQLIRVTDNGCGMSKDDAILCLERHATSKLRQFDDFQNLASMGFRGEAIPSIASVSKMTLLTCPPQDTTGTLVMVEGGRMVSCSPAACAHGTSIEVKNLFYNVPVRKKFQKSPQQDAQECLKVLSLQALAHTETSFQLISNQEIILNCPCNSGQLKARVHDVLGEQFLEGSFLIDHQEEVYHVSGIIGSPTHHRPNRTGQFLFVNHRPVTSTLISYAVKEGYGTTLPSQRYPLFVLYLTIPAKEVDVNVHPQKREVRFSQEQFLRELVLKCIRKSLYSPKPLETVQPISFEPFQPQEALTQMPFMHAPVYHQEIVQTKPRPRVIATVPGYFFVESNQQKDELILIDQRAAYARVLYDQLEAALAHSSNESQALLIPYTFELSKAESVLLQNYLADLHNLGLQIREFGLHTYIVEGIPHFLEGMDIKEYIQAFLNDLQATPKQQRFKEIASIACRHAPSQSRRISLDEAQKLLDKLMQSSYSDLSPQGKPTMVSLPSHKISAFFKD